MTGGADASRPIRKRDRVAAVLQRDPSLVDAFVEVSPAFERLRDPGMRTVMARLATVERAARVAGVDADHLVAHLNARAGTANDPPELSEEEGKPMNQDRADEALGPEEKEEPAKRAEKPATLARIPDDRVVEVDVRDDLRSGREPFSRIMAARSRVPEAGALVVRAIFEPAPLYDVMARYGFAHWTERLDAEDWRVWFYPASDSSASEERGDATASNGIDPGGSGAAGAAGPAGPADSSDTDEVGSGDPAAGDAGPVVTLDVRDLEPPEPMMRTLAALEDLPPGGRLVQINARVPRFLFPRLEERGLAWAVDEEAPDGVRVTIWDPSAAGDEDAGGRHSRRNDVTNREEDDMSKDTPRGAEERTLDVRTIPPPQKHPTIFSTFEALEPGESFILVNDHDPKPLYYEFEYEHTGRYGWEYVEEGPTVWRVRISRKEEG